MNNMGILSEIEPIACANFLEFHKVKAQETPAGYDIATIPIHSGISAQRAPIGIQP
jgi:hypothetical protein